MKKIFTIIALVLCVFVGGIYKPAYAAGVEAFTLVDENLISETDIKQDICDFVYGEGATEYNDDGARVDRTAGSEAEYVACDYLWEELKQIWGIAEDTNKTADERYKVSTQEINYSLSLFGDESTSYNLVGYQKAAIDTTDYVVIGAHYDNYYGYADGLLGGSETKSHGIYDNASGVAALLNIVKAMKDRAVNYDIYYVFFGAEEVGNYGSRGFYDGFVKKYKGDMKLMINLDSIGAGDDLYLYADEVKTPHEDYFVSVANEMKKTYNSCETIKTPPANKKVNYMSSNSAMSYDHMGTASDNSSFMKKGNNVITFFSGAWDAAGSIGVMESTQNPNVMHTSDDSLTKIEELYGDVFYKRIKQITLLCVNTLVQEDFISVMNESQKVSGNYLFWTTAKWANIILTSVLVAGFVVFLFVVKKYRKPLPNTPTPNQEHLEKLKEAVLNNDIDAISNKEE